jgi:hypothetical protein
MTGPLDTILAEIEQILASSRQNNARIGVTGALLFNRGCFAQALEGPRDAIERLYEKIACDPRHDDVRILSFGFVETRSFPDWSMAYAGRIENDDASFAALTVAPGEGARRVLDLLNTLVRREEGPARATL